MIQPISKINYLNYYQIKNNTKTEHAGTIKNNFQLSDYKISQAILNRNNISFKNLAVPIEVTEQYNKPIKGKDHLYLPDIHIYEYPDTNLQVFVDMNKNMQNSQIIETTLYINDTGSSLLMDELCRQLLSRILSDENLSCKLSDNINGFYTIKMDLDKNSTTLYKKLNDIITKPHFTKIQLEEEKQKLIQSILNENSENNIYRLLNQQNFKTKEECIEDIKKINEKDIQNYYKTSIKNASTTYFITLNKKYVDKESMNNLLKNLNSQISVKFKKVNSQQNQNSHVLNKNSAIYIQDHNIDRIEFNYPYIEENIRDSYVGLFATLILIFLGQPYFDEETGIFNEKRPLTYKNTMHSCHYHNIKFDFLKPEFTKLTAQRATILQKEIVNMINDTDYTVTLESIKQSYKDLFKNKICQEYKKHENNENLYQYGHDIFHLYEIIDSISTEDIKQHINKYILNQEPIVHYNN